jgi:integrase
MQEVTRNSYSLYKRETGSRTIWYARFWDDETQSYTTGRSTGQTTKAAANRVVQKWLAEGLPEAKKKDLKATKNRLIGALAKYLEDCEIIKKGETHNAGEIIKFFYTQVTNAQMSSGEGFIAYLYRFWDWNGDYVQDKLERGERIGRRYVDCCKTRITLHIEPYFKNILLCDVTTVLLEQFMRSFPRRDIDPKNGFSKSTINQVMKVIKKPLKEAVRLGILPRNPADGITMLREDTQERGILTPAELEGLFRIEWLDERSKIASILASVSGLRISEVTALRLDDIDARRNTIFIQYSYTIYEKRMKDTKTGKSRIIYTDPTIIQMLLQLYEKNPYQNYYIFWGVTPNAPMRMDTIEGHLEKALAALLGKPVMETFTPEHREIAYNLARLDGIQKDEIIALQAGNLDTVQNTIRLRHSYSIKNNKLEILKETKERLIKIGPSLVRQLSVFCSKSPYIFIFSGKEHETPIGFEDFKPEDAQKLTLLLGEIARRERNISFHGFRHFFNSTIRGTVSDDILRLQTGHSDEKMTDHYDHMTDDRGEQLRKAVQAKILPFIPKVAGE